MKAVRTLILWTNEERKDKIAADIALLCKNDIVSKPYDEEFDFEDSEIDILLIDIDQGKNKEAIARLEETVKNIKEKDPGLITMLTGKYSSSVKKRLNKDIIDVYSGVTTVKIKKDYRTCIDLLICKKKKLNYYLTDFFAPHLVGDLERRGFELVLNETYDRESYKEDFLDLWRSFLFMAPLLTEKSKELLKTALHTYEERSLTQEEKDAISDQFFFQFNTLNALHNFNERRLYYMERSVVKHVWDSIIQQARDIDNSLLFGCHKSMNIVRLKIMVHQPYPLKKITKNSNLYKTLAMIEPYADVLVTSNGERMVIGKQPPDEELKVGYTPLEEENLTFDFYFKVILPHRRRRGLKRF